MEIGKILGRNQRKMGGEFVKIGENGFSGLLDQYPTYASVYTSNYSIQIFINNDYFVFALLFKMTPQMVFVPLGRRFTSRRGFHQRLHGKSLFFPEIAIYCKQQTNLFFYYKTCR